jgi:hypothetical protein
MKKQPLKPCQNCVYFKVCGDHTRTQPCEGRKTKSEQKKESQTMIYINGIKATKNDIKRLFEDIKNGRNSIKEHHKTAKGAEAITTEF